MPTIVRIRCPKGHESEYGRVFIDMKSGQFRYMCLECKLNYEAMLVIPDLMPKPTKLRDKKEEEVKPHVDSEAPRSGDIGSNGANKSGHGGDGNKPRING